MLDDFPFLAAPPELPADTLHLWRARLDMPPSDIATLNETLSADEQARAARFHFERDRQRYIAARSTLRRLLGGYLGRTPASVAFRYGAQGKPAVAADVVARAGEGGAQELQFNVAHSGGLALFAFVRGRSVGVDIELLRDVPDALAIARSHFTLGETHLLQGLSAAARNDCFFRIWTRKESVIKAVGKGLSLPLTEFDAVSASGGGSRAATHPGAVEVDAAETGTVETGASGARSKNPSEWNLLRIRTQPAPAWAVRDVAPAEGYRAALCVAEASLPVHFYSADPAN